MIIGLGMDLVEIERIKKKIDQPKFVARILTETEMNRFNELTDHRKTEFLAGRFAAKEAYAKALGTGIGSEISFQDIEILNKHTGSPVLTDTKRKNQIVHITITHTSGLAAAVAVIERNVD